MYTIDSYETSLIKSVFFIYLLDLLGDTIYETTCEILEVLCYQYFLLASIILWLWIVSLPLSYIAAFSLDYKLYGIFVVSAGCSLMNALSSITMMLFADWDKLAEEASKNPEEFF